MIKAVLDRSYQPPFEKFKGKTIHLIMTGSFPVEEDGYRIVRESFEKISEYLGAEFKYFFVSANDSDNPVWENAAAITEARAIGASL